MQAALPSPAANPAAIISNFTEHVTAKKRMGQIQGEIITVMYKNIFYYFIGLIEIHSDL